jgi:site-specific DNA-methyltransferase (adenine-specific)
MIYLTDCVPFMREMEDASVDFTFFDPPYNVRKDYGAHKDDLSPEEYLAWMDEITVHARRVSRRGFAVYVGSEQTRFFWNLLPDAKLIPVHKRAIGAIKGNYFLQYHSLFAIGKPVRKCKDLWDDIRLPGEGYFFREPRFADHPGQTAMALVRKVLHHFTEVGDTVFDPFTGVGSSPVVCHKMDRHFIGTELEKKYYDVAVARVEELKLQPSLPADKTWSELSQSEF